MGAQKERSLQKKPSIPIKAGLIISVILLFLAGAFFFGIRIGKETESSINHLSVADITPRKVSMNIVALDSNGNGVTAKLATEVKTGTGLVLLNINKVLADLNAQHSARTAALVAKNITKKDYSKIDIIFDIESDGNVVGGESAGSVMALTAYAALENKTLKQGILMTGTIDENGRIGEVGGISEKALAAKSAGATLFLVPEGMATKVKEVKKKKECGTIKELEYCKIRYVEETTNLGDELGIDIKEVRGIREVLEYYLEDDTT